MASTSCCKTRLASSPRIVAPRTLPAGEATTLAKPSVWPSIRARSSAWYEARYTRCSRAWALASVSEMPTVATSGSTNVAQGRLA